MQLKLSRKKFNISKFIHLLIIMINIFVLFFAQMMNNDVLANDDDEYLQSLVTSYPNLFSSISEAKNFVYLNYLDETEWDKRVLAKLTHDIIKDCSEG